MIVRTLLRGLSHKHCLRWLSQIRINSYKILVCKGGYNHNIIVLHTQQTKNLNAVHIGMFAACRLQAVPHVEKWVQGLRLLLFRIWSSFGISWTQQDRVR